MRLNGEIAPGDEEGKEIQWEYLYPSPQQQKLVVGFALTSKKIKSFIQPKLEGLARKKGISFVAIDLSRPLSDQGPFDIILQKISGKTWHQNLQDYVEQHPEVTVLDPPEAIQHLCNRQSMLQDVADLDLSDSLGQVRAPKQVVVSKDPSLIREAVSQAGLTLPLIAKPLIVDGTAKSHELCLAYDQLSLSLLQPPLVLQEFVNHGGVLFKVFIVGDTIRVVRRFSLPNVSEEELSNTTGVFRFPRVSCSAASADDAELDPGVSELPPRALLERLVQELRWKLVTRFLSLKNAVFEDLIVVLQGLRLFNIDIIREHGTKDNYYVIDINYFPGYGKMPGYEHVFTDFLLGLAGGKDKRRMEAH